MVVGGEVVVTVSHDRVCDDRRRSDHLVGEKPPAFAPPEGTGTLAVGEKPPAFAPPGLTASLMPPADWSIIPTATRYARAMTRLLRA